MSGKRLYAAQKRYSQRNRANGDLRVTVWVPSENADELKDIAKKMREGNWAV